MKGKAEGTRKARTDGGLARNSYNLAISDDNWKDITDFLRC